MEKEPVGVWRWTPDGRMYKDFDDDPPGINITTQPAVTPVVASQPETPTNPAKPAKPRFRLLRLLTNI